MTVAVPAPEMSNRAIIARVARTYLAPRRFKLLRALGSSVVVVASSYFLGKSLQRAIDQGIVGENFAMILQVCLIIVTLGVVKAAFQILQARTVNEMGHSLVGDVQVDLFEKLIQADLSRLRGSHTGGFVSSVLYDAAVMRDAATNGVVNYIQHSLNFIAMAVLMLSVDWRLTLMTVLVGPLAFAVIRRATKRTKKAAKGAMSESASLSSAIMEGLDGVRIVKIENREEYEQARVAAVVQRRQRHLIKGANAKSTASPMTEALMTFVIAGILAYVSWRSSQGAMTVGDFSVFLFALTNAGQSMRQLANLQTVMTEGMTAARRLFEAMDVRQEIGDRPGAKPLATPASEVRFENVDFSYSPEAPALSGVTLEVRRGETVALVGPSGGGKSTILNLIPRFYDVTGGRVTIDGVDIRDITLASLRDQIGLVTQEPFLFDETIRANIAYARQDASDAEIEEAARAAAAHDFIIGLSEGYDTNVGEAGLRLSGGQRQRIAIARAFLKNAPILLLDEATSALDTESEQLVQTALERLMSGRATIVIAHRLSTIRSADRIYVVEGGRIVETGQHDELVRSGGLYARLAAAQNLDAKSEAAE